jgi:hypothetical protein
LERPPTHVNTLLFRSHLRHGLLFSDPLRLPSGAVTPTSPLPQLLHPLRIPNAQQRILWHQRLAHLYSCSLSDLHHHAIGDPLLPHTSTLDTCPVCANAMSHKQACYLDNSRTVSMLAGYFR